MRKGNRWELGRKAWLLFLAVSLSALMVPTVAFANEDPGAQTSGFKTNVHAGSGETAKDLNIGDLDAGSDYAGALNVVGENGGSATAKAGTIKANGVGLSAYASGGGSADATTGEILSNGQAVMAGAKGAGSNTTATVDGNATGAVQGMMIYSEEGGKTTVNVDDVSGGEAAAMIVANSGGEATLNADNATSKGAGVWGVAGYSQDSLLSQSAGESPLGAQATTATDSGGTVSVNVKKDVSGDAYGIWAIAGNSGAVNVAVNGNVASKGIGIQASVESGGTADILVAETVTAKNGVELNEGSDAKNAKLTVWKIDAENTVAGDAASTLRKSINYIVKLEQPSAGGTLSATKSDGSALATSHGYDVANEGDKVLLKVNLEPGYKILAAYNGVDQKAKLTMDNAGNYFVEVPEGGGVYLSVQLEKEKYDITFVNEDGTVLQKDALTYGDMPKYRGDNPTKAADDMYTYEFAGWKPTISPVTGAVTYEATFKATEIQPAPKPGPTPAKGASAADPAIPQTGDGSTPAPFVVMFLASCAALALLYGRLRRNEG